MTVYTYSSGAWSESTEKYYSNSSWHVVGGSDDSGSSSDPATIVWEDDFTGTAGTMPAGWQFDTTAHASVGTMTAANAYQDGTSNLVLAAVNNGGSYTCTQVYGQYPDRIVQVGQYIEFRAKVPVQVGVWPALWTMGANATGQGKGVPPATGWPYCGECDLLEVMYADSATNYFTTMHNPATSASSGAPATNWRIAEPPVDTDWHTYGAWFQSNSVSFYQDGVQTGIGAQAQAPTGSQWEFNQPQFPLIDIALGGSDAGIPNFTGTVEMLVDYVKCYSTCPYV